MNAIVGRPVSRVLGQDGYTAELTRCCTDGTPHVASKLIARAWRIAQQLGYRCGAFLTAVPHLQCTKLSDHDGPHEFPEAYTDVR